MWLIFQREMYKDKNEIGIDESDEEEEYNEVGDQTEDKSKNNDK